MTAPKPVVLVVIDGLTPSMFESADAPALRFLLEHGTYARAASTFPSLTPVCLSSIATGGHPDVHHIPHLVWWYREEQRTVEYGSSFGAIRAAGFARSLRDTIVDLNARHLSRGARGPRTQRRGGCRSHERRGRTGLVPRALRGRPLLRSRAVEGRAHHATRRRRRPRHRLESRGDGLHGDAARGCRAARCRPRR